MGNQNSPGFFLASAVAIGVTAAAVSLSANSHSKGIPGALHHLNDTLSHLDVGSTGSAPHALPSSWTPSSWAKALLRRAGEPVNGCTVGAITGWEGAEGDWPAGNARWHNLLNTTLRKPGSHSVNTVGVQSYTTWSQGLEATAETLREPQYQSVRAALAAGDPQAVADAVAASPWGTGPFKGTCR